MMWRTCWFPVEWLVRMYLQSVQTKYLIVQNCQQFVQIWLETKLVSDWVSMKYNDLSDSCCQTATHSVESCKCDKPLSLVMTHDGWLLVSQIMIDVCLDDDEGSYCGLWTSTLGCHMDSLMDMSRLNEPKHYFNAGNNMSTTVMSEHSGGWSSAMRGEGSLLDFLRSAHLQLLSGIAPIKRPPLT